MKLCRKRSEKNIAHLSVLLEMKLFLVSSRFSKMDGVSAEFQASDRHLFDTVPRLPRTTERAAPYFQSIIHPDPLDEPNAAKDRDDR